MEFSYIRAGEYLLPDITLREKPPPDDITEPLGRYARMRRVYLWEHRTIQYDTRFCCRSSFILI